MFKNIVCKNSQINIIYLQNQQVQVVPEMSHFFKTIEWKLISRFHIISKIQQDKASRTKSLEAGHFSMFVWED